MKVLVMEPANQQLPIDTARPNGALGPAYLVGALRTAGINADYYDATVGWPDELLSTTFYNRTEQENGLIRYGASPDRIAEVVAEGNYDVVATSSIFSAQTRMHLEIAENIEVPLLISGGVNAVALQNIFYSYGFDFVRNSEQELVDLLMDLPPTWKTLDDLPLPALDALPLETYRRIGIPHAGVLPKGKKFASIQTSRGCQDKCSFCHISMEKQRGEGGLRMFSLQRVGQMVDQAIGLGVDRLYFEDDNLFFNKKRLYGLHSALKRDGLEYSNVNGGNLRFLFRPDGSVDVEFIQMLRDFGLVELTLPFESRNWLMIKQYATGKYNPDVLDSAALVRILKDAGIRIAGNFMIGFEDESWESVLATKEYAKQLRSEGLDAVGFMIPVPYPGSVDFENRMTDKELRKKFEMDPLWFTDRMHWRGRPLFPKRVDGERLEKASWEWWLELNQPEYTAVKTEENVCRAI